ncbi:DUF294 nucleotidyltransferase-like domain-containing protein [Aeromonas simiae]|uniref:DUF294 nucleotidyltransferase-like domain-containing protein n=1 Tax=Aeromonas simiae TaxID=218936 RepID=UPI0005A7356F|nr:DUF294 nucleotidyltransferase-like domain-containing protein [Aeromonas simiae]
MSFDHALLPNILHFLSTADPFDLLSESELSVVAGGIDISYWMPGEEIPGELIAGQGLYMVRVGALEQRNRDQSLRARLGSGDLFGFSQLERAGECDYQVYAIEPSLLYRIPKRVLYQVMARNPALTDHFASAEHQRLSAQWHEAPSAEAMLYLKPVAELVNREVVVVPADASIMAVAQAMVQQHRSSALVMEQQRLLGIVTDRDMTKRVVAEGRRLEEPVSRVMTPQPCTIESDATVLQAVELMMRHNVRSLPVLEQGRVCGVLTATSLVQRSRVQAVFLISRIYRQESCSALSALARQRQWLFESLATHSVPAQSIQLMMTQIADAFTRRLLQLGERELGPPPCAYAWLVAGSQARQEMHALSDQDNALVLADEADEGGRDYFRRLGAFVCHGLVECGYPSCPGEMVAANPLWCASLSEWRSRYLRWVREAEAEALLNVSVFLDIRSPYGEPSLIARLQESLSETIAQHPRFLAILVANSLRVTPPLGLFRQFVLARDGENRSVLNIKQQAINLVVELARIYAMAAGSRATDTASRLADAVREGVISEGSCRELLEAFYFINRVRLSQQGQAIRAGLRPSDGIPPASLSQFERNHLKDAFRIIARTQEAAALRFHARGLLR